MYDQTGRLVDDQQVRVFEADLELDVGGCQNPGSWWFGELDDPSLQTPAGPYRHPVDGHDPLEQFLADLAADPGQFRYHLVCPLPQQMGGDGSS
jgi:hypothetical protein